MTVEVLPLRDLALFFKGWSLRTCLFCHCLWGATQAPSLRDLFLLHFWVTYLCAFGGALTSALVIMRPDEASIFLLGSNTDAMMWIVAWWTVNHFPFGLVKRFVKFRPVWIAICAGSAFCRASIIASRVNLAVKLMPGNHVAPLLLATMASMGGKVASETIVRAVGHSHEPSEIERPGFIWWSGFLCSVIYYTSAYFFPLLEADDAWAIICLLLIGHSILSNTTGLSFDFTAVVQQTVYLLRLVPDPVERLQKKRE